MGHVVCVLSFISRYGSYLKLLKDDAVKNLTLLMRHIKIFLSTQRVKTASELRILYRVHICTHQELVGRDGYVIPSYSNTQILYFRGPTIASKWFWWFEVLELKMFGKWLQQTTDSATFLGQKNVWNKFSKCNLSPLIKKFPESHDKFQMILAAKT